MLTLLYQCQKFKSRPSQDARPEKMQIEIKADAPNPMGLSAPVLAVFGFAFGEPLTEPALSRAYLSTDAPGQILAETTSGTPVNVATCREVEAALNKSAKRLDLSQSERFELHRQFFQKLQ